MQKGAQTFLTLGTGADACNSAFTIATQCRREFATADFTQQFLAGAHGLGAVEQQVVDPAKRLLFKVGEGIAFGDQADLPGLPPIEALGGQGVTARRPFADGLHHERADNRRCQTNAHLRQAELRVFGGDGHVAATDQPQCTAERGTLHHRQGRNFQSGKGVHQLGQLACIVQVGVVVQVRRLLHPGKIRPGTEMPATAADQ